jgi:hypothetical protein
LQAELGGHRKAGSGAGGSGGGGSAGAGGGGNGGVGGGGTGEGGGGTTWGGLVGPSNRDTLAESLSFGSAAAAGGWRDVQQLTVGPVGCCSPHYRVPFNSRDDGSTCVR